MPLNQAFKLSQSTDQQMGVKTSLMEVQRWATFTFICITLHSAIFSPSTLHSCPALWVFVCHLVLSSLSSSSSACTSPIHWLLYHLIENDVASAREHWININVRCVIKGHQLKCTHWHGEPHQCADVIKLTQICICILNNELNEFNFDLKTITGLFETNLKTLLTLHYFPRKNRFPFWV